VVGAGHGITNRIGELRAEHGGMSQKELADRIGVSRQTLNAIEGAKYSPSLDVAFKIAEVFGVPLDDVFAHVAPKKRRGR
jgi:putative transcriptional regulator